MHSYPDKHHKMIEIVQRCANENTVTSTPMNAFSMFKASKPTQCDATMYKPSLVVTLQGSKMISLFGDKQPLSAGKGLISSIDIPILSRIADASVDKPYLSVVFELDINMVTDLIQEIDQATYREPHSQAISISTLPESLMDAVFRVVNLLDNPKDIAVIYPMLQREVIYRLLLSEQGSRLRHLCIQDSSSHKVSQAIKYLNQHFDQPMKVESLAQYVNMSVSSLHQHFKAITTLTPLQFQKQLRLHQARNQILQNVDISVAAYQVGYESASQFSREYSRLFGLSPSHDKLSVIAQY